MIVQKLQDSGFIVSILFIGGIVYLLMLNIIVLYKLLLFAVKRMRN